MSGLIVVILSHNAFAQTQAQTLHNKTVHELAKQPSESEEIAGIKVGNSPIDMALDLGTYNAETGESGEILYVANRVSATISVISAENNTVIGEIPVQDPVAIDFGSTYDPVTGEGIERVYVVNTGLNSSVSVISIYENNSWTVENIPVDEAWPDQNPITIGCIAEELSSVGIGIAYVSGGHNISLISVENNTVIGEISPESDLLGALAPSLVECNKVYVTTMSDSILAISFSLNDTGVNTAIEEIPLPDQHTPSAIAVGSTATGEEEEIERVYVATEGFNVSDSSVSDSSVSVISIYENNSWTVENIPVQDEPTTIAVGSTATGEEEEIERAYVANAGSDSVSVISIYENNSWTVENIPVQHTPSAIAVGSTATGEEEEIERAYVANAGSDSVSVISIYENNSWTVENIPVQDEPTTIARADDLDTVYVANAGSDSVSVIDGSAKKVVAGVTFKVYPFNSGHVECDRLSSPLRQQVYVYSGSECIAKPNDGFEFVSWEENLGNNSTQPISASGPVSLWDSFVLTVGAPFGYKPDQPEAMLNVTKFGTFTANFREAPPPLPPEFWAQMYAVIATVITALFIPSIVGWFKSKREAKKLNDFHNQIDTLYQDGKLDEKDIEALDKLRKKIENAYPEGKLNEKHYESLSGKISVLYDKIFKKRINDLSSNAIENETRKGRLDMIRKDLDDAYSEGKINEKHYTLLNEDISKLDGKEGNNNTSKEYGRQQSLDSSFKSI